MRAYLGLINANKAEDLELEGRACKTSHDNCNIIR